VFIRTFFDPVLFESINVADNIPTMIELHFGQTEQRYRILAIENLLGNTPESSIQREEQDGK